MPRVEGKPHVVGVVDRLLQPLNDIVDESADPKSAQQSVTTDTTYK